MYVVFRVWLASQLRSRRLLGPLQQHISVSLALGQVRLDPGHNLLQLRLRSPPHALDAVADGVCQEGPFVVPVPPVLADHFPRHGLVDSKRTSHAAFGDVPTERPLEPRARPLEHLLPGAVGLRMRDHLGGGDLTEQIERWPLGPLEAVLAVHSDQAELRAVPVRPLPVVRDGPEHVPLHLDSLCHGSLDCEKVLNKVGAAHHVQIVGDAVLCEHEAASRKSCVILHE
mmetsp:Transcript_27900/g.61059  ORF Transcript_27900/g.61059 Transcript_27900/m.61059 type:complete len:228 (+) Transcript_27900:191-874(+)